MFKKPIILLCDDELKVTAEFKLWHGGKLTPDEEKEIEIMINQDQKKYEALAKEYEKYKNNTAGEKNYDVRAINQWEKFDEELKKMKKAKEEPAIILIDLQHTGKEHNEEKDKIYQDAGKEVQEAIDKIEAADNRCKKSDVYKDHGLKLLKKARIDFPDTPISIYTGFGLVCAKNETLEEVAKEKGEWVIKRAGPDYEHARFKGMLESQKLSVPDDFQKMIFFISPFGKIGTPQRKHSDNIYDNILEPLRKKIGMNLKRADKIAHTASMIKDMYEHIYFSEILIADIDALNPNVLHEIGLAFAWGKCPIIIVPESLKNEEIAFDIPRDYPKIFYDKENANFTTKLLDELRTRITQVNKNPDLIKRSESINLLNKYKLC